MAITVTNSNNRRNDAEATTNWASDGGGGAGPQNEPDLVYQNTQAVSRKIGTTLGGLAFTEPSGSVDMTAAADSLMMFKGVWVNSAALVAAPSARHKIGSSSGNWYGYQIVDDGTRGDIDAPPTRLWTISSINPNVAAWRDFITGTPNLAAVTYFGIQGDFSGASKSENVAIDALDIGPGLFLVGNTPDGTFEDFKAHDEDTLTNRFGHVVTIDGIFFLQGAFVIGRNASSTVSATTFTDSNKIIQFPAGRVDEGDNVLELDLGNSSTAITMTAIVIQGKGRNNLVRWFNPDTPGVDGTNNEIDIIGHGFLTGDAVVYSSQTGSPVTGLTSGVTYFVRAVTADAIALYPMSQGRDDAYTDTSRIGLTAISSNRSHSLTRTPITWPDILFTGTSGTGIFTACTLNNIGTVTMTSGGTIESTTFNGIVLIDLAIGATLDEVVINNPSTTEQIAVVTCSDLSDVSNCTFNANADDNGGHAVEIDTAGTFSYVGNSHVGYGPNQTTWDAATDVDAGLDVITVVGHPWVTGDAIVYGALGNTPIVGLDNDGERFYARSNSVDTISMHRVRSDAIADVDRRALTVGTGTHTFWSANAALLNSSSGTVTMNITGTSERPTFRDTPGSTTVINVLVPVEVNGLTEGTSVVVESNETAGTVTIGDILATGFANASGEFSYSQNYEEAFGAGLDVIIRTRNQGIAVAAIAEDNTVFVDETIEANSNATADQTLLPATPVSGQDYYYWGHAEEFGGLKPDISTAGIGTYTITWQYWNGAWTSLSGVTDGTDSYKNAGVNKITFTIPGDWATTTINGQGPLKYIRASLNAGTVTTVPKARKTTLDTTRYLPFVQTNTIANTGLSVTASWVEDAISQF
jgi:hypothetical protein